MAESEEDVLVQRVVKDITNAFKRNPNIDEIGVIPCPEARYNRSPIVLVDNKLGVESWCVKFLLPYVHNKLVLYRQRKHWLDREALVDLTSTLLLLHPDFTTAWNVRKELLQSGVFHPDKDLYLAKLALTKFPKSPETWIHRRWVLQHMLRGGSAGLCGVKGEGEQEEAERSQQMSEDLTRSLQRELQVCSDAACRYPSNYNAWSHRIWVLQHMAKGNVKVFHDELSSMAQWVSAHVSDHSGFHYRQFLLKELVADFSQTRCPGNSGCLQPHQCGTCPSRSGGAQLNGDLSEEEEQLEVELNKLLKLFHQEMELCSDLIQSFPGHETLWSHRRHVFYLWHQWRLEHHHLYSSGASTLNNSGGLVKAAGGRDWGEDVNGHAAMEVDGVSLPRNSKRLKRGLRPPSLPSLSSEFTFVCAVLDGPCHPEQRRFALAYKKWLDTVICKEL
ncbi:protein prenyltransferase alpha subunit repeat-containing protein 1 [Nerophis lumbriciformis]|uniref:protein prenyltransferase alpha subunit repeat-containing protein 1 n=1 Tax=Nerophis lumbriciformis TaxID=546530 RepID=UPI002ADFFA93|nr:protein prenyltransferase alpha subunit repeat-containing protein 1-like [Nerophis lumbriciformis]